ncbi:Fanconi anemia group A protein-like [Megalops cyprinoides]|uniref:Fanconi anemia group A protein-like n=1 Tax=Megalops cyprinoides TaxID=118141 RepID=UPI001863A6E6|nr:Fanconi anemia group A protein-like [Megalops cyprinoides]
MSLDASGVPATAARASLSALLAPRRGRKRDREEEEEEGVREEALRLLNRHQDLRALLEEVSRAPGEARRPAPAGERVPPREDRAGTDAVPAVGSSLGRALLVSALQDHAHRLDVPVAALAARLLAEKVATVSDGGRVLLTSSQKAELSAVLRSARELASQGAFSSEVFCQELWNAQDQPLLQVVWSLHASNVLTLEQLLDSREEAEPWLGAELRALCELAANEDGGGEGDDGRMVLSGVASVLVRAGFEEPGRGGGARTCGRVLDGMLSWVLDSAGGGRDLHSAAESWVRVFDASSWSASVSANTLRRFLTHSLTHTLTYKPRLTVSDAIAMQSQWSFAETPPLLTSLYRKLGAWLKGEGLLGQVTEVLQTREVNWRLVLGLVSAAVVHRADTRTHLTDLLSRLLRSSFEEYDLENLITAFLLARQGALEGPAVFPSYAEWFKTSFGGAGGYHGSAKKPLLFLLKFLSDLVPHDPPQYLKVHLLHPPFVAGKHRPLLLEYVALAKTRLADLQVPVEDMGLYENTSPTGAPVQPECQAHLDAEKAVSLFESTGKVSAAVMEASIFRKTYFLSRFLPALLTPRVLPDQPDARMAFIESLRKTEKIPASMYSSYARSCQREAQRLREGVCAEPDDQDRLWSELQELRKLVSPEREEDFLAGLSRVSASLGALLPDRTSDPPAQVATFTDLDNQVANAILRSFCQCLLDASGKSPPNRQGQWANHFIRTLRGHAHLLPALLHRLSDLLGNQGAELSPAHVLGLAAFAVHLHASQTPLPEVLGSALQCSTHANMSFCLRFCVAAVSYGLCRRSSSEPVQDYIPSILCKKLLYLVPRLIPETRAEPGPMEAGPGDPEAEPAIWRNVTDPGTTWESSARLLWGHAHFHALKALPGYQLSFSDWLEAELKVQRSQDALTDPERQQYQQWACHQRHPPDGGGDPRRACSAILRAATDLQTGRPGSDTCLPDVLSRLQELLYDLDPCKAGHFLLDVVSDRLPATYDPLDVGGELDLERTLRAWNSIVVALPPTILVGFQTDGARLTLDLSRFVDHVNQNQRNACSPPCQLPYLLTLHFLRGVLGAAARCDWPGRAVSEGLERIHDRCPLLLVSVAEEAPPPAPPGAPPLLLAACLYHTRGITPSLRRLSQQPQQVLVFLLFFYVTDLLTGLLQPQESRRLDEARSACVEILTQLDDCSDWLLLFEPSANDQGPYRVVTMVTTDRNTRLMPLAFYSLVPLLDGGLLGRAVRTPGFLLSALRCYSALTRLYLEGGAPGQVDTREVLSRARNLLLRAVALTPSACLSRGQRVRLQRECGGLDPDVAAAAASLLAPDEEVELL